MKRFIVCKICFDFVAVTSSFILAYVVKFKIPQITLYFLDFQLGVIQHHAQIEPYLSSIWAVSMIAFLFLLAFDGYRPTVGILTGIDEIIKVAKAMSLVVITIILVQFFVDIIPGSRMVVLYFWLFSIGLLSLGRLIILRFESSFYAKGMGSRRALIVGSSMLSQDIAERMIMYPAMGYYYVGSIDDAPPEHVHFHLKDRFKLLGSMDQYAQICVAHQIDAIFLIKRDIQNVAYRQLTQFSLKHNIQLNVLSEPILDTPFTEVGAFDGISMISTMTMQQRYIEKKIKRLFDVVVSLVGLMVLTPLFLCISFWIKQVSPAGPVLFRQSRVGQFGQEFKMLKFRSMIPDAEKSTGPVMVDEFGDYRYIKGGSFYVNFHWMNCLNYGMC